MSAELYELQNMITIGNLIVQQSIDRNENRGGFVKIKIYKKIRKKPFSPLTNHKNIYNKDI